MRGQSGESLRGQPGNWTSCGTPSSRDALGYVWVIFARSMTKKHPTNREVLPLAELRLTEQDFSFAPDALTSQGHEEETPNPLGSGSAQRVEYGSLFASAADE